jgi:DNA-binding HxlR family transcriptional regulator
MPEAALCARFHKAVELIGRRWSGAIIQMLFLKPARFAELRGVIPDITDRMLSERLQELEEEGLVVRTVIPETPVRVEYRLSPKGRALEPAMGAIGKWAEHGRRRGERHAIVANASREAGRSREARHVEAAEPHPLVTLPPTGVRTNRSIYINVVRRSPYASVRTRVSRRVR